MTVGEVSSGEVLGKLASARLACSTGALQQGLRELETAREWMRLMPCTSATLYSHHAFGALDANLQTAREAVREGHVDAEKRLGEAIMQAQSATQSVSHSDLHSNWV